MSGSDPIAQTATAVRPVDGMASDGAGHNTLYPDAEIGTETFLELRCRP
jgi:hypothetical protein